MEQITSNDIAFIEDALLEQKDFYKNDGFFVDLKKMDIVSKDILFKNVQQNGYDILFPTIYFKDAFFKYLQDISQNPSDFIDKDIKYEFDNTNDIYIFTLIDDEQSITIVGNILILTGNIDFPYSEKTYLYSFEKQNQIVLLSKINMAG